MSAPQAPSKHQPLRLAEVLGALSLATDLANGQPAEHGLRAAMLATRLARDEPLSTRQDVFWAALLRYVGCNSFAVEEAAFAAGDDIGLRESFVRTDLGRPSRFIAATLRDVGRGAPLWQRVRGVARLLTDSGAPLAHARAQCDAGVHCSRKLAMSAAVEQALADCDERFDGRGLPDGKAGLALNAAQRYVEVARVAVVFHGLGGLPAARAELRRRAGGHLDPEFSRRFEDDADRLCSGLTQNSVWDDYLECEPGLWLIDEGGLGPLFDVFALVGDLKSGYFAGHSQGVAALAHSAAQQQGLPAADALQLCRAALLHDLGRVVVPTGVWDKPGSFTASEWERVHLHSYYTDRVLRRSQVLVPFADLAGRCHERLDASGYHRGDGVSISRGARLLAASDVYRACLEDRAHRRALGAAGARRVLIEAVEQGRLCRDAVAAVLAAAGEAGPPASADVLSARELDVLRLLVRGLSNKQIARLLAISPRTVQHHTIHIYAKSGVKSRAGVALWAIDHGLFR